MGDLIKTLWVYITDKDKPLSKKLIVILLSVVVVVSLNDYLGFTYYYSISKEVEIINNIETAKSVASDIKVIDYLNEIENDVVDRKYLYERFGDLFKKNNLTKDVIAFENKGGDSFYTGSSRQIVDLFPEMPYRSQLWHTLTSSLFQIILSIYLFVLLIFKPFRDGVKFKLGSYLGLWVICIISCVFTIWLVQYLFGLIPVILNRAYINYTVQILIQLIWMFFALKSIKKSKV